MLRTKQKLGKYRIERRLASGGFADVYYAHDTVEGFRVALKVPRVGLIREENLPDFRHEVRVTARLDHPNILPIKDANFIGDRFVITTRCGEESLADRIGRRMSLERVLDFTSQMLEALAHAHERRVIHCDVKPENFIVFPGNKLRLTDFGIARFALKTLKGSGSGTVGYVAPEQALGKPSCRSDVFSVGLLIWRMISGKLPEWPYEWPLDGAERAGERVTPEMIRFLRKAIQVDQRKRYASCVEMLAAYRKLEARDKIVLLPKKQKGKGARRRAGR